MQSDRHSRRSDRALSRGRRRARRGAAMVEAVIVIPVLGLLLVAVPLVFERYATHQEALATVRRCAFVFAVGGCRDVPPGCDDVLHREDAPETDEQTDVVAQARSNDSAGDGADVFEKVPEITQALNAILGETVYADVTLALRPRGERSEQTTGHLAVACNERATTAIELARRVLCTNVPILGCGG